MNKLFGIGPISQLLTMSNLPLKGALTDDQLEVIENAAIIFSSHEIIAVGEYEDLKEKFKNQNIDWTILKKKQVCLPGFIDSHTHICFGGSRANDFAMRNSGKTYLDIAKAGGGIWDTVTKTRKATGEELANLTIERANYLLSQGITTAEVKSGYGLNIDEELKMLRAIKKANKLTEIQLISTCLAAHMKPKDIKGNEREYLDIIRDSLFPILKSENLTTRIDAFVEQSAFSIEHIKPYFEAAKNDGFDLTVHADQFTVGGSQVAAEFGAVSADHLEASTEKEIELLAQSDTVATVLPGASIGLGCGFAPARKLLDVGACVSIASDWNPGSAPQGNLIAQSSILATFEKLTNAEVLAGITFRAAHALRMEQLGKIEVGFQADFVFFPTNNYQEITYQQGRMTPNIVYVKGRQVL